MKSVSRQFREYPLPTRSVGDGKMVIIGCVVACALISALTIFGVVYIGLNPPL